MAVPTEVNVVVALVPRVVMAPMQTTMIRASMTAYSTAVGPSSRFTKSTTKLVNLRICLLQKKRVIRVQGKADLCYDADVSAVPTEVNVVLALVPKVVMAPMQTTMIRASMTAYSTAVGPSSRFTK